MAAIKEPGRPRRYKLTHRSYVCDRISQVGDSFLMDASDILSMGCLSDRNKNSQDDDHDGSSVSKIVRQMDGCESPIKRVFTPVCISEKEILHITVVTLKHLPQQFLGCPLCLNSTYSTNKDSFTMLSRARCHSPETLVDLDVRKRNTALVSRTTYGKPNVHPPNFLNLPKCSSNEEVVRSPIVVMADTEEKFIQSTFDNPFYNILPPCSSLDCTESGHSTLTKKSSRLTDSNRISQIPLESPPRKQQRISCYAHELSSETKDSDDSNEMPSSVTPTINKTPGVQREGCINKVIAEFTLLNVERDLIMNSVDDSNIGSVCIPPVNACFSSSFDVHRDSIQCSQLSYSTAKKRDHASESQLGTDSEDSVLLTSPSASSQPVPRLSRRRNATSDNCCDDVRQSSQCDKLTLTIETLFVGENCLEHCGDNQLPVYVMEQWTAQVLPHKSYVCDRISQVGDSFLMDASDILSMGCLSDRNKNSQDDDHDGSSVSKIVRQMDGCESPIKRVFTPVCISEKEILHITVVTLKHLPQQFLGCPLCLNSTYSTNKDSFTMLSRARCHSPETLVDLDVRKRNTALVSRTTYGKPNVHPPNFLNLPKCSSNEEVVRSPIVVMADTEEKFIQSTFDNPFYNILPPCSSLDCTESGHSTLTKKSSRLTDSNRISQIPLESPPRKQQRISCYAHELSSETKDSDDSNEMPSSVTPTINKTPGVQREGCINKVIAEFTLLNVERDLIMNSVDDSNIGSVCIPPVNACFSSSFDVHRDSIQCSQLSYSTAKKRDHASESQLGTDSEDSVLLTSPSASSQPVPRLSRRRNATSVSVWPSSSFHNDGTPFFNRRTGLPLQSSPVPLKRSTSGKFDFDLSLNRMKTSRSSICMVYNHNLQNSSEINTDHVKEPSSGMESLKSDKKFNNNTDNSSNDNNETNSNKSNQTITSFRRRPSSLRFTSQYQEQSFERNTVNSSIIGGSNNRHAVTGARRRNYPVEMDSIELSCSAPPSGGRGFQPHKNITSRLANTMACTPVPHGSSQHLLVNFEVSSISSFFKWILTLVHL
uniref:Uncharacterized protein n=1 Tax=Schistosoma haematobium TaxID=6185 RepID=A0A095B1N1_SCHHA